jgi:hypothetical protein
VPAVGGYDAEHAFAQGEAAQPAGEQAGEEAGGVSHEWLLATGSNLPPSLPREGWQTVRVGRPGKDRQGLPPPARSAIDGAMRADHAAHDERT